LLNKALSILVLLVLLAFTGVESTLKDATVYEQWNFGLEHYASTAQGLIKIESKDSFNFILKTGADRIMDLAKGGEQLGIVTYNGRAYQYSNGKSESISIPRQKNGSPYVLNGILYKDGCWWISALEGMVFQIKNKSVIKSYQLRHSKSKGGLNINSIGLDNDDNIWVSSLDRVYFLTGIHKRRKNKLDFLASSEFEFEASHLFTSAQGVFVLSKRKSGENTLSLGTLKASMMDAIRKEIHLPDELSTSEKLLVSTSGEAYLTLFSQGKLYTFKDFNWTSQEVAINYPEANSITVLKDILWVGGPKGLMQTTIKPAPR